MSTFNETITLTNVVDKGLVQRGLMPQSGIRSITVNACVDTGSWFLVLNEEIHAVLGLEITGAETATLADGSTEEYPLTEPVEFRWKDRKKAMNILLVPNAGAVLFGALCMEALDVVADPVDECLVGRHGDKALYKLL
jgi:predicted aspartyl protease